MKRTFNAVMAYEDARLAERAQKAWEHLMSTLQGDHCSGLRLWQFDLLRTAEMRGAAARDAAQADMILIATRGTGELPTDVKDWIDGWLVQKRKAYDSQRTLAALFGALPMTVGIHALAQFAYLQRVARRGNMDFLVSTFDLWGENTGFCRLQNAERPRAATGRIVMPNESRRP